MRTKATNADYTYCPKHHKPDTYLTNDMQAAWIL